MTIRLTDLGKAVLDAEYAVRGPIVARAAELEKQGREIIYCNIGNPQSLGQRPLTWNRQILALCEYPALMELAPGAFPPDVIEAARAVLAGTKFGLGAYSESRGVRFIREAVAEFILERDHIGVDPDAIFLTDGASKGVQTALRLLISGPGDGIMIPIPQYPLYSATITLYEGRMVPYYLDEANGWKLSRPMLEAALAQAKAEGTHVKAICVINPGNPTGAVLDEANIEMIIDFAKVHGLTILADEVYQENIYLPADEFVSFAKVLHQSEATDVSLFSFHSCSKGFLGECGVRGGYFEYPEHPPGCGGADPEAPKRQPVREPRGPGGDLCHGPSAEARFSLPCPVRPGKGGHPRRPEAAGHPAGRRAEPHRRHHLQCDRRSHVRLPQDHPPEGAYRFRLRTGPAGTDRHLRGAGFRLRPGRRHRPLPHHHPAAHGEDPESGGCPGRVPQELPVM